MKANYGQQKAKPPRAWQRLREDERNAIVEYVRECLDELVRVNLDHEEAELQKTWLKMGCIINYEMSGYAAIRNRRWLSRWKRLYKKVEKYKTKEERDAFLDPYMEKIFGKGGYPSEWVDSLENRGNVDG